MRWPCAECAGRPCRSASSLVFSGKIRLSRIVARAPAEKNGARLLTDLRGLWNVRFGWWSQPVDATLYPERERSVWRCVEDIFEASLRQRKQSFLGSLAGRESLKAIRRAFGKPSSSIYFQLAPHGGIRPPPRRRSRLALTLAEREEISRAIAEDQSTRSIARLLGRSPSTVSKEISRNGGYDRYRAALADEKAWDRARRPKRCKLANNPRLRQAVAGKLRLNWSPEQIAGWLKKNAC